MYIPQGCSPLSDIKDIPQIRLGLQGFPKTGKTWSALTFPNPIVANLDRGLGAHIGRKDVIEIPFHSDAYCLTVDKAYKPANKKDILIKWLETHGRKLTPEQTLIWDGNTPTQNAYHRWFEAHAGDFVSSNGTRDGFAEWKQKINFYQELIGLLMVLPCHVVYITHEAEKKEKSGQYNGNIRPLLTGQYGDEIVGNFTDWFRQKAGEKLDVEKATPDQIRSMKDNWGMTKEEYKSMQDSFPNRTIYYWQTSSDDIFDGGSSSMSGQPKYVPANFSSFEKYRRKLTI
jgi:hypothetical protein